MDRTLCTVQELVEDLGQTGLSEAAMLSKISAASQAIEQTIGQFLPRIETIYFAGTCKYPKDLWIQPLLSVTSIAIPDLSITLTNADYILKPDSRHWRNGPYSWIEIDPDSTQVSYWGEDLDDNVIVGKWGLYDETVGLGLTASQLLADTTLVVTDGSLVCPGMVLQLESEWELVTSTGAASASTATLNGALDDSAEEITVSDGTKIKVGELIKIGFELMKVLDVAGNVVLAARGVNGSKRASHLTGTAVYVFRTFNVTRGVNGSTAAAHTSAAIARQVAPADVNYLCRQMASLMIKKAQTGYVGRAGNDEMGTGFFVNEFPKNQVEAVKKNYFWGGV